MVESTDIFSFIYKKGHVLFFPTRLYALSHTCTVEQWLTSAEGMLHFAMHFKPSPASVKSGIPLTELPLLLAPGQI